MPTILSFDELNNLNDESEPFALTDKIVKRYVTQLVRLFSKARSKAENQKDLYAIMTYIYALYDDAWELYRGCLTTTYEQSYKARLPKGTADSDAAFLAFINDYVSPECYVPKNEWQRKRDRAFESIATVWHDGKPIRAPVEEARNAVVRQVKQGADDMTARAIDQAYSDAGVKHVRWVTEKDARVCKTCRPRDEKVYTLDDLPEWPAHYNCRCHVVAID